MEACALKSYYVVSRKRCLHESQENVIIKFCKSEGGVSEGTSLVKISQSCHFNIFGISHRCLRKMPIKKNNE